MDGTLAGAQKHSDLALGALLVALGAGVLLGGYAGGLRDFASAEYFPALIAVCMCAVGVLIALVGWLTRDIPPYRWTWLALLAAGVIAVALNIGLAMYFTRSFLLFGPAELATTIILLLAQALAFARRAHWRALGMMLIGLLLSTFGIDIVTGRLRFTFGLESFLNGMDILVLAPGILIVAEALLCLYSPQLWFSTFKRWLVPGTALGPRWPVLLRVLSVAAIAGSVWLAWEVHHNAADVAFLFFFGLFGAAAMLLGWNRLVLCFAFYYGRQFEEALRQTLFITNGHFATLWERPLGLAHLLAAAVILAVAFALWLWRVMRLRKKSNQGNGA